MLQVKRPQLSQRESTDAKADPKPGEHRRLHEIHFPQHLLSVIRRERARADRQKGQFSLVMFRLVPARGRWATLRLGKLVLDEVRTADEVGQFDRHTVCAILPGTTPDGSWKLIDRVVERSREKGMIVEPVVYAYPSSWFDRQDKDKNDGNDNGSNGHGLNGHGGDHTRVIGGTTVQDWLRQAEKDSDAEMNARAERASRRVALPLETLLVRRPAWTKRVLDMAVAGFALTLASPVLAVVALLIKTTSDGPIIFKQWRSGMGGRPFQIYKFRTMCVNADALKAKLRAQSEQDGPAFKMTHDPRVTSIGRFLRKTSLDELPQLFNVLKGDMSLVGPRPLPLDEQAACDQWHKGRLEVMPGLTCIWQVHGRSRVTFEEWMRMDLSYIRRGQLLYDLKLMFETIPAVLLRRGAK